MNSRQRQYLEQIGIPVWSLRGAMLPREAEPANDEHEHEHQSQSQSQSDQAIPTNAVPASAGAADVWVALRNEVTACTRCVLHSSRTQTVFGVGRQDARLMIIGEAPGAEEDRKGEPFVGPAGQLLNVMLRAIGFAREDVYIANVLKCRPPHNRDPGREETGACSGYLERQIALVRPHALLAVGRIAAQWLLQSDMPIGRLRGAVHRYGERGIPLVVTYHPAYLLRTPIAKAKSWQDLCTVKDLVTAEPDTTQ